MKRFRFKLRTLFLVVIAISLVGGMYDARRRFLAKRVAAITSVQKWGLGLFKERTGSFARLDDFLYGKEMCLRVESVVGKYSTPIISEVPDFRIESKDIAVPQIDNFDLPPPTQQTFAWPGLPRVSTRPPYNRVDPCETQSRSTVFVNDTCLSDLSVLKEIEWLTLSGTGVTDDGMASIALLPNVVSLELSETCLSDRGLVEIGKMRRLGILSLSGTNVSDKGLSYLSGLPYLSVLDLEGTHVTTSGIRHLREMKNLAWLKLGAIHIDDDNIQEFCENIEELCELTKLQDLDISYTNVSDDSIKHFGKLKKLKHLSGLQTRISMDGILDLQRLLPNTEIFFVPFRR